MSLHNKRFPGESQSYREARDALLLEEIELRRRLEEAAQLRRRLPPGGEIPQDYVFKEGTIDDDHVREVRLSELFEPDKDTLVLYNCHVRSRNAGAVRDVYVIHRRFGGKRGSSAGSRCNWRDGKVADRAVREHVRA